MLSLGLYNGHNAAICIMQDGEVTLNWELERFSRVKHDWGFNPSFLEASLRHAGIQWADLDIILTNSQSYGRAPKWIVPSTDTTAVVEFDINGKQALAINHHLCHVSSTYFTSTFDEATVVTQDGGGDNENFSIATGIANKIATFETDKVQNIASWWSGITLNNYRMPRLHAWDPGSGAGKIMALAAYGTSSTKIEAEIVQGMNEGYKPHYTDPQSRAFNNDEDLSDTFSQRSKDVAASLQSVTEKQLSEIYEAAYKKHPSKNLCLAGGIALNCVANTRVNSPFTSLHVPPFPNDTGLAAGMCLFHWHHILDNPKQNSFFSPYLGPEYSTNNTLAAIKRSSLRYKPLDLDYVVERLLQRRPICVARGRSEAGPRALGNRSIVAIPDMENGRDILNFKIKNREWYRPYAPIVLEEYAGDILEDYNPVSPYMTTSATIKKDWRNQLSAVNHVDNSTRPQIISRQHNPFIYDLISKVHEKTGIPVLLNTSFNKQEPIVETPEQAINTFMKFDGINLMVLHDFTVDK